MEATNLAAAILALANFTGKLVSTSYEIYEASDGAPVRHQELILVTKSLRTLFQSIERHPGRNALAKNESEVETLAMEAQGVTKELLSLLYRLRTSSEPKQKWKSVRQALLTLWKDSEVRDLEQRVNRYRTQLDTALLHDLRTHVAAIQSTQTKQAKEVSGYLDILTKGSHQLKRPFESTYQDMQSSGAEAESTDLDIPDEFATLLLANLNERDRKAREDLLIHQIFASVEYRDMPTRYKTIPAAYKTTFDWIFQSPKQDNFKCEWDSFSNWLQGSDSLYWIAGKPGSGKSTLMKYLFDHPQTRELVKQWPLSLTLAKDLQLKPDPIVSQAGFFFWNSGTELQRSRAGFLRSLLKQLCKGADMARLFPERWKRCDHFGWSADPFTWDELLLALDTLLSTPGRYFLLFIDGLDEFDGDKDELANVVSTLASKPSVKICAASRPWVEFRSHFYGAPQLLMENLTRGDIMTYIDGRLAASREFQAAEEQETVYAQQLRTDLVTKAAGVFLWVYVAVTNLLHGVTGGTRIHDLIKKLDNLPPELDDLFDKILKQLEPKHAKESSELFQFVRANSEHSTLISLYWSQLTLKDVIECEVEQLSSDKGRYFAEVMQRNLLSRCKCLLDTEHTPAYNTPVTWLHRTVREYLEQENVWQKIRNESPNYQPEIALAFSALKQAKTGITSKGMWRQPSIEILHLAITSSKAISEANDRILFLDQVETTGSTLAVLDQPSPSTTSSNSTYWLSPNGLGAMGTIFPSQTTLFHFTVATECDWYVRHRLASNPQLLHMPATNNVDYDVLVLACTLNLWDMQFFCLQQGSDVKRTCRSQDLSVKVAKTGWQIMLQNIADKLQASQPDVPWDKVIRNMALFLKKGAYPHIKLKRYDMELDVKGILGDIFERGQRRASPDDIEYIREAYRLKRRFTRLNFREKFRSWRAQYQLVK